MHSTNAYPSEGQQGIQSSLKRETTDDLSKMYTTLYDAEDQLQQQEYALYQQQRQEVQASANALPDVLLNAPSSPWNEHYQPASPTSSCYSGSSSSSDSAHSSPAVDLLKTIDQEEADELAGLFNITIEDLLSGNPLSFNYLDADVSDSISNFSLFAPQQPQPMTVAALHFDSMDQQQQQMQMQYQQQLLQHNQQQQQHYQNLHSQQQQQQQQHHHAGPHRSRSLSPVISSAPYPATQQSSHSPFLPHSPEQRYSEMTPPSPAATYAPSPSPCPPSPAAPSTPCMSPISPIPTTAAITTLSNAEGMTMIKNEDGSIMVYNPQTESMTFRCELCPSESFGRIHDLKRHQTSKHQAMTWPCEFCNRPFARRDALLRHYTVKSAREDGVHPASHETEKLLAARSRAKLIC
ncbi:hypothetical protein BGZ54_010110 [Gamsiella multidivaricata]|nr:hypothetical protein BGZ54_010110 [Gamsiella multidivaricata]